MKVRVEDTALRVLGRFLKENWTLDVVAVCGDETGLIIRRGEGEATEFLLIWPGGDLVTAIPREDRWDHLDRTRLIRNAVERAELEAAWATGSQGEQTFPSHPMEESACVGVKERS